MSTVFLCFFSLVIWSLLYKKSFSWHCFMVWAACDWGGTVGLISLQLLEMELVPFSKKEKKGKKTLSAGGRQERCFQLVWKSAMESCSHGTCSQQPLGANRCGANSLCGSFLMTSLSLFFWPQALVWGTGSCQELVRQEARGKGMNIWARGGVEAKASSSQRSYEDLFFSVGTHKLEAIVFTPW